MGSCVFITGMFRSGTTLLGMMCQNHGAFRIAQDPYAPLFRAFRNEVDSRLLPQPSGDFDRPIEDYYFHPDKLRLMNAIRSSKLDLEVSPRVREWLARNLNTTITRFAPELGAIPASELQAGCFRDLFESAVEHIRRRASDKIPGFKQVWMGEFVPLILEAFPDCKVLYVMRDPRAVCASKQTLKDAKYPWLFLIRHWRKHVVCAWLAAQTRWRDRLRVVKYEDLVTRPEQTARSICGFLGVDFSAKMIDASQFLDGEGKPWSANSSHEEGVRHLNPAMIDAWRGKLDKKAIAFVEALCLPEAALMEYQPEEISDRESIFSAVAGAPGVPRDELAEWIRPYAAAYESFPSNDMGPEYLRLDALQYLGELTPELKEALFLDGSFADSMARQIRSSDTMSYMVQGTTA